MKEYVHPAMLEINGASAGIGTELRILIKRLF